MRVALKPHPSTPCGAVRAIVVDVSRVSSDTLAARYLVHGDSAALAMAPESPGGRADELWKHTCFEAFILGSGEAYVEYNFSPSMEWAMYAFDAYRSGMRESELSPPWIEARPAFDQYELTAIMALPAGTSRIALSAVIEEADGRMSYWALAHPKAEPDFHHPGGFTIAVSALAGT